MARSRLSHLYPIRFEHVRLFLLLDRPSPPCHLLFRGTAADLSVHYNCRWRLVPMPRRCLLGPVVSAGPVRERRRAAATDGPLRTSFGRPAEHWHQHYSTTGTPAVPGRHMNGPLATPLFSNTTTVWLTATPLSRGAPRTGGRRESAALGPGQ